MAFKRGKKGRRGNKGFKRRKPLNHRTGGFERLESKFLNSTISTSNVGNTWANANIDQAVQLSLTAPLQGNGENDRNGRKCTFTYVEVRGYVSLNPMRGLSVAPGGGDLVRIIMFQDTQTNGAQAPATTVMDAITAGAQTLSQRNLEQVKRFRILGDQTIRLDVTAGSGVTGDENYVGQTKAFFFKKKIHMPVIFSNAAAAITSVSDNSIHMLAITTGAANTVSIEYKARARFTG